MQSQWIDAVTSMTRQQCYVEMKESRPDQRATAPLTAPAVWRQWSDQQLTGHIEAQPQTRRSVTTTTWQCLSLASLDITMLHNSASDSLGDSAQDKF